MIAYASLMRLYIASIRRKERKWQQERIPSFVLKKTPRKTFMTFEKSVSAHIDNEGRLLANTNTGSLERSDDSARSRTDAEGASC